MSFPIGATVRSIRCGKQGTVVGYGSLMWPTSAEMSGDGGIIQAVYLVQVSPGSSSLGPACLVFHHFYCERVEETSHKGTPGGYIDP